MATNNEDPRSVEELATVLKRSLMRHLPIWLIVTFLAVSAFYILWATPEMTGRLESEKTVRANALLYIISITPDIAATLIAALASIFVIKVFFDGVERYEQLKFARTIADTLTEGQKEIATSAVKEYISRKRGGINYCESLPIEEVESLIREQPHTIIIDTWISTTTLERLTPALRKAFDNRHRVTIALLHPHSPTVSRRQADFLKPQVDVTKCIQDCSMKLRAIRNDWMKKNAGKRPNLEIIYHDRLPAFSIYMWQNKAYLGLYLNDTQTTAGPQLALDLAFPFGRRIEDHVKNWIEPDLDRACECELDAEFDPPVYNRFLRCQFSDMAAQISEIDSTMFAALQEVVLKRLGGYSQVIAESQRQNILTLCKWGTSTFRRRKG